MKILILLLAFIAITVAQLSIKFFLFFNYFIKYIFFFTGTQPPCRSREIYRSCGPNCDTYCSLLGQPCTIRFSRCPDGCYCRPGYARDSNLNCIRITYCP